MSFCALKNVLVFLEFYLLVFTSTVFSRRSSSDDRSHCLAFSPLGTYRGVLQKSALNTDVEFCSFLGIRYGQPPTEDLRFEKPVLAEPVKEVYNATSDGKKCPQIGSPEWDEDCLFLNVFTPKKVPVSKKCPRNRQKKLKPVIVWIYGGAFMLGSSSSQEFAPDYLIEHDIIMVAMNYRVNVFGFLNLGIPECGGNMGLRDQTLALEWVRKNIRSFGGDPDNVTLMGQSAGAISAHLLALSPVSRDLFHKVIIHSAIGPVFVSEMTETYSLEFAKFLGYDGDLENRVEVLRYFKKLASEELFSGYIEFHDYLGKEEVTYNSTNLAFWPSVDAHLGDAAFLPNSLEELGKDAPNIPIIAGQTDQDATVFFYQNKIPDVIEYVQKYPEFYIDPVFAKNTTTDKDVIAKVKEYYFHRNNSENLFTDTLNFLTFIKFYKFYEQNAYHRSSYLNGNIYNFQFCFDGSMQYHKHRVLGDKYSQALKGVSHTDELNYLFYVPLYEKNPKLTAEDTKIIHYMTTWWTNFARTGNPNSDCDDIKVEWKPISPEKMNYLLIDLEPRFVETRIKEEDHQFWDSLPPRVK